MMFALRSKWQTLNRHLKPDSSLNVLLTSITFVVLIMKLIIWIHLSEKDNSFKTSDSYNYLRMASRFFPNYFSDNNDVTSLLISPGYPFFLWFVNHLIPTKYISLFSSIIPLFVALVIYRILKRKSLRIASMAYLLTITEPVLFLESFYMLSDTFFLLVVTLASLLFIRCLNQDHLGYWIGLGVILSFSALVRPVALYLPILALLYLSISYRHHLKRFLVAGAVYVLIVSTWIIRNFLLFDVPVLSSVQYENLVSGEVVGIRASAENQSFDAISDEETMLSQDNLGYSPTPRQKYSYNSDRFLEVIRKHPDDFVLSHLLGTFRILFGYGRGVTTEVFSNFNPPVYELFSLYSFGFTILLSGSFLFFSIISFKNCKIVRLLFMYCAYFLLLSSGATSYSRFRIPIIVAMIVICCIGFEKLSQRRRLEKT